ncbi:MAG TPA: response regulator, partial [Actinomycetota bacterium]|nr:response regulator [Actinomycetota bacterium]
MTDDAPDEQGGPERILVVDDDPDIARFIDVNLRAHGYDVVLASDGVEALEKAREAPPNLALVDVMMPRMDGFELVERLRGGVRTANVPVIILTARALTADKVVGLTAGADDYIIKPFDPVELVARVKGTLRRAQEMRAASPLTGLPGNVQIREHLTRLIAKGQPFALLYADLDNFKAYNDHYGFLRGDVAIRAMSHCIQEAARDVAGDDVFVGHVGGDDFVVACRPHQAEPICETIVSRCSAESPKLYDDADRERGHIEVESRRGGVERFPMLSISIGAARSDRRPFTHPGEAVEV